MAKDQDQEKEQKPKKMFTITIDIYDSGDVDSSMVEYRKSPSGLGRPRKWEMTAPEFVTRVEEILGDYNKCLADWNKAIGKEAKQFMGIAAPSQMMAQASQASQSSVIAPVVIKKEEKKDTKKDKPKKEDSEKDEFDGMEFGEFDKDNNPK